MSLVSPVKISFYIEKGGPCNTPTPFNHMLQERMVSPMPHLWYQFQQRKKWALDSPEVSLLKKIWVAPLVSPSIMVLTQTNKGPGLTYSIKSYKWGGVLLLWVLSPLMSIPTETRMGPVLGGSSNWNQNHNYIQPFFTSHCTDNSKHIFLEMKLLVLIPKLYIYVSGSDISIPTISLIWNLYFPVLHGRTLGSTAVAERRAWNCRQACSGWRQFPALPSAPAVELSSHYDQHTNFQFGKWWIINGNN
jgi:hypothetical protein